MKQIRTSLGFGSLNRLVLKKKLKIGVFNENTGELSNKKNLKDFLIEQIWEFDTIIDGAEVHYDDKQTYVKDCKKILKSYISDLQSAIDESQRYIKNLSKIS
jgi:hypothetical protein